MMQARPQHAGAVPSLLPCVRLEDIVIQATLLADAAAVVLLEPLADPPCGGLRRFAIEAVACRGHTVCDATRRVIAAHRATLTSVDVDVGFPVLRSEAAVQSLLALLRTIGGTAGLQTLTLQLRSTDSGYPQLGEAHALGSVLATFAAVPHLRLDVKRLPLTDGALAAVVAAMAERVRNGRWTMLTVDAGQVRGAQTLGDLRFLLSAPRCRVSFLPSCHALPEVEALAALSDFF